MEEVNFCEWKEEYYDGCFYITSCGNSCLDFDSEDNSITRFIFCPFCGKPIHFIEMEN